MTEKEWLEIFGENLLYLMERMGYTQRELADAAGLSESAISHYINKQKIPGVKAIINLAYVLDCDVADLIDFSERIK